ncbi:MAG: hypothetical protein WCW27_05405 [Patescibacteria group bacterium]|jgi:hypothetical protein
MTEPRRELGAKRHLELADEALEVLDPDHPPSQSKNFFADRLERIGILVPRRFANPVQALQAMDNGISVIARSEHPAELHGMSGLLKSYDLLDLKKELGVDSLLDGSLETKLRERSSRKIQEYCRLLNLDYNEFIAQVSYSFWERIPGYNRYMCADTAIPNRYHIFTNGEKKKGDILQNYTLIDGDDIILDGPDPLPDGLRKQLQKTLDFYKQIRNTPGLDSWQCPLIEFQTNKDENYFLQYRFTRSLELSNWQLSRELESGEFLAEFVRGVTPTEGLVVETIIDTDDQTELDNYDASFDYGLSRGGGDPYTEIMSHRRQILFAANLENQLSRTGVKPISHLPSIRLFNPRLFVVIPEDAIPKNKFQQQPTIKIKVVSDGRKAYCKILD